MLEFLLCAPFFSIVIFLIILGLIEANKENDRGSIQLPTNTVKNTMIERYGKNKNPWDDIEERKIL